MDDPKGKFIFKEVAMLDYKSIVRLKRLGLNNAAIANSIGCKWDSVQRIVSRCENVWGRVDGVPDDLINEEIADVLFSSRKSVDLDYFQPDCERSWRSNGKDISAMSSGQNTASKLVLMVPPTAQGRAGITISCFL